MNIFTFPSGGSMRCCTHYKVPTTCTMMMLINFFMDEK